ncbi:SiaC family regulatory phosphoprotein [Microscilla marina]|uniref:SiaC family regulatory phosphoprotein domain-containing protein n=1 Tax=Microscilla marina ATCC 23134 TaxID=313606 RepID=A1ZY29_MICM2|nr:SiaC family regulatory phosphoprotein [Microscilla marina]EAY24681.1 hypothetical protein M23134_02991 [Microscilla marina ATCC 23134]
MILKPLQFKEEYEYTPLVILNAEEGTFKMKGDVLPDDQTFCDSILDWLTEYVKKPNPFTTFRFYLHYINEEGGKLIINIIKILKVLPNMTIEWYHHVDDEDLKEYGEELSEELDIPFKYLPVSEYY